MDGCFVLVLLLVLETIVPMFVSSRRTRTKRLRSLGPTGKRHRVRVEPGSILAPRQGADVGFFRFPVVAPPASILTSLRELEAGHSRAHKKLASERNALAARLRTRLRNIIKELELVLAADDPRWEDFGLESPAAERARKPAREKKAEARKDAAATRRYQSAMEKLETAKIRAEKARVRTEKAQTIADLLRIESDKAAAIVAELMEKALKLKPEGVTAPTSGTGRATEPSPAQDPSAVELIG